MTPSIIELDKSLAIVIYDEAIERMYNWYPIAGDLGGGYACNHCNVDVDSIPSLSKHPDNSCTYRVALVQLAGEIGKDITEPIL